MDFSNEHELRAFLRICIEPGERRDKRTPVRLAAAMPAPVLAALAEHAPHVDAIRQAADTDVQRAEDSRNTYAAALLAWIRDEQPTRHVRALVQAGEEHVTDCVACTQNGVISHLCPEGRRLVASFLAPSLDDEQEEAPCAHESWEVTSEYRDAKTDEWVQSRRCGDCRESLESIRSTDPHWPAEDRPATVETAAAVLGHRAVEETAAAYVHAVPEVEQQGDDWQAPDVSVLPWLELLRGEETGNCLGEIALAMHHGKAPRGEESTNARHRRTLGYIDIVLATWRDAVEGREPAAYRSPDGRIWTAAGVANGGHMLYENATAPVRYTASSLRRMYDDQGGIGVHIEDAPAAEPRKAPTREGIVLARVASEKPVRELAEIYSESGHRDRDAQRYAAAVLADHARRLAGALRNSTPASVWDAAEWLDTYAAVMSPAED